MGIRDKEVMDESDGTIEERLLLFSRAGSHDVTNNVTINKHPG